MIVGGGDEAVKRTMSLQGQGAEIIVISETLNHPLTEMSTSGHITIQRQHVVDPQHVLDLEPDVVITTTNDHDLNQKIVRCAKEHKILAYSSDDPLLSDFTNPSQINIGDIIKVAISTGGQSPVISKRLRVRIEPVLKSLITDVDIHQIHLQAKARSLAKARLDSFESRRSYLNNLASDPEIEQLIKDGHVDRAERKAIKMLENRSDGPRDY